MLIKFLGIMNIQKAPPSSGTQADFYYGYVIVLSAFIIAVAAEGLLFTFGVFFDPMLSEFGWTRAAISGVISLGSLIKLPVFIIAGRLTDKAGSRRVLLACGLFLGVGLALMSQTRAMWHLYFYYGVIASIGFGLFWIPIVSTVPRWFVRRRALMMGVFGTGIGTGHLIAPPIATWLIFAYGWRPSYIIIGLASMTIIMLCAGLMREPVRQPQEFSDDGGETIPQVSNQKRVASSLGEALRTWYFWVLGLMFFAWVFCFAVVMVHSVIHAMGQGMSPTSAAKILSIIGLTGIFGRLGFGRLADMVGIKYVMMASFLIMAAAFGLLLIGGEMGMVSLFAVIFGIAGGTPGVLLSPIVAELFGMKSLGAISGAILNMGSFGFMTGPVLAGHIFDVSGSYRTAFFICAFLSLVSFAAVALLPLSSTKSQTQGR